MFVSASSNHARAGCGNRMGKLDRLSTFTLSSFVLLLSISNLYFFFEQTSLIIDELYLYSLINRVTSASDNDLTDPMFMLF